MPVTPETLADHLRDLLYNDHSPAIDAIERVTKPRPVLCFQGDGGPWSFEVQDIDGKWFTVSVGTKGGR